LAPWASGNDFRDGSPSRPTALAFGIFFSMEAQFWINLQTHYDLRKVRMEKEAEMRERIEPIEVAAVAEDPADYK
jgi:plasmid maintenance system antidote protein VapI